MQQILDMSTNSDSMQPLSDSERLLNSRLASQPARYNNRYNDAAARELRQFLFRSLAAHRPDYLLLFFPNGPPHSESEAWSLRSAQGAIDGAEYTAAAKGTACGHIFKSGESTYHCKTCAADDTCVLCARCFDASDHDGHQVFVSVSPGNSGCCDCGDREAWRREVPCTIHSADAPSARQQDGGKEKAPAGARYGADLPVDLVEAIRMTIARAVDYLCDVFSCSPEQMRLAKTEQSIMENEVESRLGSVYGGEPPTAKDMEYALVLWNDEKHTVYDVQNQVARACQKTKTFGYAKAMEVNDIGRSVVSYSTDLKELIRQAEIIEQLKVTVTIRSSRDTFREHMCETIIDWISDIAGCAVGSDAYILRNVVCEELLKPWRIGSQAINKDIGKNGIDDHETEDNEKLRKRHRAFLRPLLGGNFMRVEMDADDADANNDVNDNEDDDNDDDDMMDMEEDEMEIEVGDIRAAAREAMAAAAADAADMDIDFLDENEDTTEVLEATFAGYPPPPPPPSAGQRRRIFTPTESDDGEHEPASQNPNEPYGKIPKTPHGGRHVKRPARPSKHWLEKPDGFKAPRPSEPCEDLWRRVRLDFMILYDLRLWKVLRIHLRHLYITTVVTIPHFKRILGLRFAGLYTALAQLYLIADREPDHSIINLSVQMLTTPTITQEVVERGNFLTNLMAILYTFLTTRQVGFPEDVSPRATLAFDSGAVTNRRMFHFFLDLRWLFQSEFVLHRMRVEQRYLLQFLDLIKLHQGVCPNVRATSEHVEYESDAWISASMVVKEINKLCKQIGLSFDAKADPENAVHLQRAVRTVAQVTLINSYGCERKRFHIAEIKDDLKWHAIGPFEDSDKAYSVPYSVVQVEPMSFHHPLHYMLSWLIENAKSVDRENMRSLLHFSPDDLKDPWNANRTTAPLTLITSDELLSAIFDHPLRVCVWLAQMKAGMWVRNGITLRHQAHTYRSVSHRDVGYQRDILMIQAGFVLCGLDVERPGERFLAQMIDRFQLEQWVKGDYAIIAGFDELQQVDVIEDFYHLLVIALSERGNLIPNSNAEEQNDRVLQHDIAHTLCFKPLSFSDIANRVTEKVSESDDFSRVLENMSTYRPPEGLSDTGMFELKPEFIELVDPYYAHYSRNHREEAESIYKKHLAGKTGKKAEDVVYEPNLRPIPSGLFRKLSAFTSTPLFARVISTALSFAVQARGTNTKLQLTRIETFLHMVLHLAMIATIEDTEHDDGFVKHAASPRNGKISSVQPSVVSLLVTLSGMDHYSSCHPTIKNILRKMQSKQPEQVSTVIGPLGSILDRAETGSPASISSEDKERKKQEALARQARVMAQMKQQQNSFLQNQGLFGFDDFEDVDDMSITDEPENVEQKKIWNFPTGTCIWCQEETDEQRLYGTFAFLGESDILRSTPIDVPEFVKEVVDTPDNLDRPADEIRPFGVAGDNKRIVQKVGANGQAVEVERQGLSKIGFPHQDHAIKGPVATSCGHIMHFSCFELYQQNSHRRHQQQIARNHAENPQLNEFTCPLCKALGNTFLPIIWKAKECAQEHELHAAQDFGTWLCSKDSTFLQPVSQDGDSTPVSTARQEQIQAVSSRSSRYVNSMFAPSLVASMSDLSIESPGSSQSSQQRYQLRRSSNFSRFLPWTSRTPGGSQSSIETSALSPSSDQMPRMGELLTAYQRIDETIRKNALCSVGRTESGAVNSIDSLSNSLGLSISAFEISHRGVSNDVFATSLLAELPEQLLTHFRVLSETVESHLAVNVLRAHSINPAAQHAIAKRDEMVDQLFGIEATQSARPVEHSTLHPLFSDDIFLFFIDWLSFNAPNVAEASNMIQLFYWAEVCKTIMVYAKKFNLSDSGLSGIMPQRGVNQEFRLAVDVIMNDMRFMGDVSGFSDAQYSLLQQLAEKYALVFLRKCIVAMYVRYGLDFECPYNIKPETNELQRLTALLHLMPLEDLCTQYVSASAPGSTSPSGTLRKMTRRWILQAQIVENSRVTPITLPHPAIFELVGLPKSYDALTEEAIRRSCPTTGKELTDPALCLMCGTMFCSQAVCCVQDKDKGGCYQHMMKHGMKVGVFLNIRKCMVLFLHGPGNGSFANAPYLDKHGEPDPTLRKHHQLFLNQKRYDKLIRDVWLQHLIPTVISRKLEGDINPGGWGTL